MEAPSFSHWALPSASLALQPGEVHLWRVSLAVQDESLQRLAATLSPDEQERAARFRFPKDRLRFIAARSTLRRLLASYAGQPPASLVFGYAPGGKPFLQQDGRPAPIQFNLAHSHGMAFYGFALGVSIGVDIEKIRPEVAYERLASRFFSAAEAGSLAAFPPEERLPAFFRAWSRKEAFLKGLGQGLRAGLASCQVSLEAGSQDALLSFSSDPAAPARWRLMDILVDPAYCAALAVECRFARLRFFQHSLL